jgi:nicotinate-nucleotide adenylyltransferase
MNKIIDNKLLDLYQKQKLKIGILGGSFDPPHIGHLHIALKALETLGLNELWLALSPQNPLKPPPFHSYEDRICKLEHLIKDYHEIKILTVEKDIGINLTSDLFDYLIKKIPNSNFCFIIGADIAPKIHEWEKFEDLIKLTNIVIFSRARYSHLVQNSDIMKKFSTVRKVKYIPIEEVDMSSTELRNKEINDKNN